MSGHSRCGDVCVVLAFLATRAHHESFGILAGTHRNHVKLTSTLDEPADKLV